MAKRALERSQLNFIGGLITVAGTDYCLGDLWHAEGHGTFCPNYGKVPVEKAEADAHNKALDAARLTALDEQCEIGQGEFAYLCKSADGYTVTTFSGTEISRQVTVNRNTVTFCRGARQFQGRLNKTDNNFNFRRIV